MESADKGPKGGFVEGDGVSDIGLFACFCIALGVWGEGRTGGGEEEERGGGGETATM